MAVPLTAKAGIDTTGFSAGVQEIRNKLTQLNTSLAENRQELKDATKEANNLRKAQQDLASAMKNGGTEEQKREMQELSDKLAQVNSRIGTLKTTEAELRSAVRGANKELDAQYEATRKTETATTQATSAMNSFATALKAVIASAAVKTLGEWLFGSNAEMEQYVTSFSVMLGDMGKAQQLMDELTNFAAVTPFELTDVIGSTQMLMNYGIAADEVVEKMTQLGNLAGGNAQKLDRVTIAYGQMLAKGKVTNEEMRQMLEAGVPILQAIADTMGITTAEVQDLASKSKIGIDELNNAIASLTSNGGQFAGMMEKQSETMLGMASTAKDIVDKIGRDIGDEAFENVKDEFDEVLDKVQELEESGELAEWAEKSGKVLAELVSSLISLGKTAVDNKEAIIALTAAFVTYKVAVSIAPIVNTLTTAVKGLTAAMAANPYALVAAAIAAVAVSVTQLIGKMNEAAERAKEYNDAISEINKSSSDIVSASEKEINALDNKMSRYDELRKKMSRTTAESEELKALASELQTVFGNNVQVVNELTGEYNDLTNAAAAYGEQQLALSRIEATKEKLTELYKLKDQIEAEQEAAIDEIYEAVPFQTGLYNIDMAIWDAWFDERDKKVDAIESEYGARLNNIVAKITDTENEIKITTSEYYETVSSSIYDFSDAAEQAEMKLGDYKATADDCRKATNELANSAKTLSNAFAEQEENGSLSTDTILSLVDAGYAAALAVDAETGAVRLDAEAYRELAKAKLEAQKVDLLASKAEIEADYLKKSNQAAGSGDYKLIERIKQEKEKATAEIDAQLMALGTIDLDKVISGDYGKKTSTGGSKTSSTLPEEYTKAKKDLKYRYDMGEFESDSDYYDEWYKLMREHGIAEDSDEWRSANVAKKNLEDKLKSEEEKAAEKAAKDAEAIAKQEYSDITKAFKESSEERIKQIDKELEAKKKAADEAIEAIDAEIEARRRAKEDDDLQSEIDAVNAQLKYAQLDDFSRAQLERKRQQLYDQQADIAWERNATDRKAAINNQLEADEEAAAQQKENLSEAADAVETALNRTADGLALTAQQIEAAASALQLFFGNLSVGSAGSAPNITNNITTNGGATTNNNTFSIGTENYTAEQLVRIIFEVLGNPTL